MDADSPQFATVAFKTTILNKEDYENRRPKI
jgi:hypothetical protein